jgi:hypothetical protein
MSFLAERAARAPSGGGLGKLVVHAFGFLFLVLIGFSILTNLLVGPVVVVPCTNGQPCGAPPTVPAVIRETGWRSSRYGFSLEYPASVVKVSQQTPSGVVLAVDVAGKSGAMVIEGFGPETTPAEAISDQVGGLGGVSQLAGDTNPAFPPRTIHAVIPNSVLGDQIAGRIEASMRTRAVSLTPAKSFDAPPTGGGSRPER